MALQALIDETRRVGAQIGVEPAALFAVMRLESGALPFAEVRGRQEPLIRFEGHVFDRLLPVAKRERARAENLSSPKAGAVANPATQSGRWRLLERAAAVDREAAYESTSWGLGQVMGMHWEKLGYANVDALVAAARSGIDGQMQLLARYVLNFGLSEALRGRDWTSFARGYNGAGFRRNAYDTRLAAAYADSQRLFADPRQPVQPDASILTQGSSSQAVRDLQMLLSALGYALRTDGDYGADTAAAVRRFQRDNGLASDGICGPLTRAAIQQAAGPGAFRNRWRRLLARLRAVFRRQ